MGFIRLAQGIIFDTTNEEGRILHADSGECLALDQIATRLLQSGIEYTTKEEVIANLQTSIEASAQQLDDGLQDFIQQLRAYGLLDEESQTAMRPSILPGKQERDRMVRPAHTAVLCQKQQDSKGACTSWEVFLTGKLLNEPLPPVSLAQRIYAMSNVIRIFLLVGSYRLSASFLGWLHFDKQVLAVQQREWKSTCRSLSVIHGWSPHLSTILEIELLERLARRELIWCQIIVRLFAPIAMCLIRSVALCAYLRAMGLPAQIVIGRERFALVNDGDFHAWVELAGRVVNDHEEVQTGYTVMHRIPTDCMPVSYQV